MGALSLLGVILVSAKVLGYTALSWAVVTAPFWIPLAVFAVIFITGLLGALAVAFLK